MKINQNLDGLETGNLVGDEKRISQILVNLLSNAIKFSNDGAEISITVTSELSMAGQSVDISVIDQGAGLKEEDQQKLFKPFSRASDPANRAMNPNGNGFGLYICKSLAVGMEGTLTCHSRHGFGSKFTLSLDLATANDAAMERVDKGSNYSDISGISDDKFHDSVEAIIHSAKINEEESEKQIVVNLD